MRKITRPKSLSYLLFVIALLIGISALAFLVKDAKVEAQPLQASKQVSQKQIVTEVKGDKYLIYVAESTESPRTLVTTVNMGQTHPLFRAMMSISPDGQKLLYITAESTSLKNAELYLVATDGRGTPQKIANFADDLWTVAPVWSPDSQRLALVRRESPANGDPDIGLSVLHIDDGTKNKVPTAEAFQLDLFLRVPEGVLRWSEDGDAVQYVDRYAKPPQVYETKLNSGTQLHWDAPEELSMDELSGRTSEALPCAVPALNQTAYNDVMQTCGGTIRDWGCALTSATMVANYYGVNIDPPTMNSRLGGYACPLAWYAVANQNVTEGRMSVTRARHGFSYERLQEDLNNGRPPLVWVRSASVSPYTHFVVVTSGSGTNPANYSINDPADGSTNRTLAYYTNNGWWLSEIDTYSGTPACNDSNGGDLSYGETTHGLINPSYDFDDYYFNGTAGEVVTIRMNKTVANLDSYLLLYNPDGSQLGVDDDSGGDRNSLLTKGLPITGRYKIQARGYEDSTGPYALQVTQESVSDSDDGRWIAFGQTNNGTINPSNDRDVYYFNGSAETVVTIRMNKSGSSSVDSYLELYNSAGSKIAENDDGGGDRNSWLVKELPSNDTYRLVARSWNYRSTGSYSVSLSRHSSSNLALNKGAAASSVEFAGVEPYKAFDGQTDTRWSSQFSDPGWIYVDLGSDRTFNKVILKWESAYAKRYGIYVWTGSNWQNLYWTDSGDGGIDTITFSSTTGRHILMYGVERGTPWGYSLWEFEVYNTPDLLMPLVPPDPSDKEPDTLEPLAPLGPNDEDKEPMLVGENDEAQENFPLAADTSESDPTDSPGENIPYAEIISPSELDSFYTEPGHLRFEGYAVDNDENGESIVAYHWRSSLDGDLSTERAFTMPMTSLTLGQHTIYFKAQDNEGNWSEEATKTIQVGDSGNQFEIYLPILLR